MRRFSRACNALVDFIVLYHAGVMSPDRRSRRRQSGRRPVTPHVRTRPSSDDAHEVAFFRRPSDDDPGQAVPGREFLNACPVKVRATMRAVLARVAAAPPKRFAGRRVLGGDEGRYDRMVRGPRRWSPPSSLPPVLPPGLRRRGPPKPLLVVICGLDKPFRTELSAADYRHVRDLGEAYLRRNPCSLA